MQHPAFPPIEDLLVHAPFVRAVAAAAVFGDADVDDVVQATWLAAMEKPPRHGRSVRGWLATVARNAARGRGRTESRRRRREGAGTPPEPVPSPADITAREEVRRKLLAAVLALDEPSRDALLLRYYEDLPPRQVAARLGVPVETARTRIKRGLARLRDRLDDGWDGDRRAWAVLVAPLAGGGAGVGATAAASAAGTGLLLKAIAAVLLVGVTVATIHVVRTNAERQEPALDAGAGEDGNANPPVADARLRPAPAVGRAPARGRGRIHGEVLLDAPASGVRVAVSRVASLESLRRLDFATRIAEMFRTREPRGAPDATAVLRADGTFTLEGLAAGLHVVSAVHRDGFTRVRPAMLASDAADAFLRLDLTRGEHTLRGRVRDATGRAVDARVLLSTGDGSGMSVAGVPAGPLPTALDAEGRFAFGHLQAGRYRLTLVEEGRTLFRRRRIVVPRDEPLEVVLGAAERLRGTVVDAATDAPIAGATVVYFQEERNDLGGQQMGVVTTNGAGRFDVPLLGKETGLFASAPGYPGRQSSHRGSDAPTLRLDRGMAVDGTVRTKAGEPVVDATVRAGLWNSHRTMSAPLTTARTDSAGHYRIEGLEAGAFVLLAWGEGWMSEELLDLGQAGGEPLVLEGTPGETIEADLVAVRAARVTGRVLDAGGEAAAGASVTVRSTSPAFSPWGPLANVPLGTDAVFTDGEGRFTVDTVLPAAGLQVKVRAASGIEATTAPFEAEPGVEHEVEISLPAPRSIQVVVVDEEARPIRGATLYFSTREGDRTTSHAVADAGGLLTTGADGTLTVPAVPAGPFTLEVRAVGFQEAESAPLDGTAEDPAPVRVALARLHAIEGELTARASLPWERVRITVRWKDSGRTNTCRAEKDGTFRTAPLARGDYELDVVFAHEGATWTGSAAAIAGATDVHLRLEERRAAPETGPRQPTLPRWTIEVLGPDGRRVPRIARRHYERWPGQEPMYGGYGSGRGNPLTISAQPNQTEEVWVEIFGATDDGRRALPYGAVLLTPGELPVGGGAVTVRLPPERQIEGRLLEASGKPVVGVAVQAYPCYDQERLPRASHDPHAEARSSTRGAFRLRGLGEGTYELRVQVPGRFVPPPPAVVAAGADDVEIRLREAAQVTVRVVDADGQPCAKCTVSVLPGGEGAPGATVGPVGYGVTDTHGRVAFANLDPERVYRLVVAPGQDSSGVLPRTLEAWVPKDTEVELPRGYAIAGVVVDDADRPVPGAYVQVLTQPPSGWEGHYADADGRFRIGRLPSDDATIRVTHHGHVFPWGEPERQVRPGDETLRLVVKSGGTLLLELTDFAGELWSIRSVGVTDLTDDRRFHVHCGFDASGKLLITGLDPTRRYALDVQHGEAAFVRSDLAPGSGPIAVRLEAGLLLVVRVDVPGGLPSDRQWGQVQVTARSEGWMRHGHLQSDGSGRFVIRAVPAVPCEVTGRLETWLSDPAHPERPPTRQEPSWAGTVTVERADGESVLHLRELAKTDG